MSDHTTLLNDWLFEQGRTCYWFAKKIGVNYSTAHRWLTGELLPGSRSIEKIVLLTNHSVDAMDLIQGRVGIHKPSNAKNRAGVPFNRKKKARDEIKMAVHDHDQSAVAGD